MCFPPRSGPLFNSGFLRRMLFAAVQHSMEDIQPLVKTLICESECTTLKSSVHGPTALINQGNLQGRGCVYVEGAVGEVILLTCCMFTLQWNVV